MPGSLADERKLAAIMFTDMVGFSALAQRNEALALELLEEHRCVVRGVLKTHGGREVKTTGDGFLIEFASTLAAVQCAIDVQAALHARNLTQPQERQARIRIGIHVGDVVARDGDVHGDGVNLAARIEPLAEPGGICLSRPVYEQVANKLEVQIAPLGRAELKNIKGLVEVHRVVLPWLPSKFARTASKRSFRLLLPWAVAVASAAAFLVMLLWPGRDSDSRRASRATGAALRKFELAIPPPKTMGVAPKLLALAISPDGKKFVYLNAAGLWACRLDRIAPPVLLVPGAKLQSPFWSPESTDIGYFEGNKLLRVALAGGQPTIIWVGSVDARGNGNGAGGAWFADGRIIFTIGHSNLFRVEANGGQATSVLSPSAEEFDFHDPCALTGGRGVVFSVHRKESQPGQRGPLDTLAVWTPETGRKDLIQLKGSDLRLAAYSASGHLVFQRRWIQGPGAGREEVWAFSFSLGKLERTGQPFRVAEASRLPSLSADGSMLSDTTAQDSQNPRQMVWVNRSGRIIEPCGPAFPNLWGMRLSPDERQVIFSADRGESPDEGRSIWMFDFSRGSPLLLNRSREFQIFPHWFPDGRRVLFSRILKPNAVVLSQSIDGVGEEEKVLEGFALDYSRTGKYLLQAGPADDAAPRYVELAHPERVPIFLPPRLEGNIPPKLSPDESRVVFCSAETGQNEIYVVAFPGFTNKTMISLGAGGQDPQWRRDGSELFYVSLDRRTMMSARVQQDDSQPKSTPVKVFDMPDGIDVGLFGEQLLNIFDVTADGQRFLMLQRAASGSGAPPSSNQSVLLVENWFEEFREKR